MSSKNQINILIFFWHFGIGGVQRKIVDLTHFNPEKKFRPVKYHIIIRDKNAFRLDSQINPQNTKIYYRPVLFNGRFKFPLELFFLIKTLQIRPVTILTFLDYASIMIIMISKILFFLKIRIILNEDTLTSPFVTSRVNDFLIKLFYPQADIIVSPTSTSKMDLVNNYSIAENKIRVVYNWTLKNPPVQKHLSVYDLLYMGRFDKQKNLIFLLKSVLIIKKQISHIKICLIGEGKQKRKLMNFIKKNKLTKNVIIRKSTPQVGNYFNSAKIFTMVSSYEGMPVALLEAMAFRMAIVLRKFPGLDEYFQNGKNGFVETELNDYADKIIFLLKNDQLRKRMGNYNHYYVKKYFSENMIKKYKKFLLP